jgi:hypothetical protein
MIGDHARRARLGEAQLRVLVKVTAPGHDLGHDPIHGGVDAGGGDLSERGAGSRKGRSGDGGGDQAAANSHGELPFVKYMLRERTSLVQAAENADLQTA